MFKCWIQVKRVCQEHRSNLTWEDKNRERQQDFSEIFNIYEVFFLVHISQILLYICDTVAFIGICDITTCGMWFIVSSIVQSQRYRINLIHTKFQELNKVVNACCG